MLPDGFSVLLLIFQFIHPSTTIASEVYNAFVNFGGFLYF